MSDVKKCSFHRIKEAKIFYMSFTSKVMDHNSSLTLKKFRFQCKIREFLGFCFGILVYEAKENNS